MPDLMLSASSAVKVKWARQLQTYVKLVESIKTKYWQYDLLSGDQLPRPIRELSELAHHAQDTMVHEAKELSCRIAESGTNTDMLLASRLYFEHSESFLFAGAASVEGRGEVVAALPPLRGEPPAVLLVTPAVAVSTADAFALFAAGIRPAEIGAVAATSRHLVTEAIGNLKLFHTRYAAQVAKLLRGQKVNVEPHSLVTPLLHHPDFLKHRHLVSAMIENQVQKPETTDCLGRTALHVALDHQAIDSLQQLLDWNVPINSKDILGRTALHIACEAALKGPALALKHSRRTVARAAAPKGSRASPPESAHRLPSPHALAPAAPARRTRTTSARDRGTPCCARRPACPAP